MIKGTCSRCKRLIDYQLNIDKCICSRSHPFYTNPVFTRQSLENDEHNYDGYGDWDRQMYILDHLEL